MFSGSYTEENDQAKQQPATGLDRRRCPMKPYTNTTHIHIPSVLPTLVGRAGVDTCSLEDE